MVTKIIEKKSDIDSQFEYLLLLDTARLNRLPFCNNKSRGEMFDLCSYILDNIHARKYFPLYTRHLQIKVQKLYRKFSADNAHCNESGFKPNRMSVGDAEKFERQIARLFECLDTLKAKSALRPYCSFKCTLNLVHLEK